MDVLSANGSPLDVIGQGGTGQQNSQLAQYALLKASQDMRSNRMDDAIASFKRAVAYDPQNVTALTYIGDIYLSQNKTAEAIKAYKDLIGIDPTSAEYRLKLANTYLRAKMYQESEETFKLAARLDSRNPVAEYTLGLQYVQTDRLQEAEMQFRKVQRMTPGDGNVYYALGSLYNNQGKYSEALLELKTALSLKRNFYPAEYELGVSYSRLEMKDEAVRQLKLLVDAKSELATDLQFEINRPRMLFMEGIAGGLNLTLGPNTPLWMLDPINLTAPNSTKNISVTIQFNTQMDRDAITAVSNWSISRARSATAGYYNNSIYGYAASKEATISAKPLSVIYNDLTMQATVTFSVSQNVTGDAVIDPKHLVFKYSGTDAYGRAIDTSSDEIDGYSAFKAF
jgi:tetratricopeptide (TPR) repeat protein